MQAIGQDSKTFSEKMAWLKDKWGKKKDSTARRLIGRMIFHKTIAINLSIIADNLEYFKANYEKEYPHNLETALDVACLCGSKKIAEFTLKTLESSYTMEGNEHLLGYASASMNEKWVKDIASIMAKTKKDMPDSIYGLASYTVIDAITKIFKDGACSKCGLQ